MLGREGVIADVGGIFLNEAGEPVQTSLNDRMIGITADQLRGVEEIIGIPYGMRKQAAVEAALRSGLINSMVTHASLARALIANAEARPPAGHPVKAP
jgi:DNA-binding transcriptional regulator LsrR (DeoR family)